LGGRWIAPQIDADPYKLTNAHGTLSIDGQHAVVDVEHAASSGGTLSAHYVLPQYAQPYPMSVDLRYSGISIESLFATWGMPNTGLRGAATGRLTYHWNKDKILEGAGEGTAALVRSTAASRAKYPIPVSGTTAFGLDNGVITFRRMDLATPASTVALTGRLRIETISADFRMKIHSTDFAELDRIGYDFAHAAGKKAFNLLGLGGSGDITGTVAGPLKAPEVVAHVAAAGTKFHGSLLGDSDIDLRYSGRRDLLTLTHAMFREAGGSLALSGTIAFPARGPSPRFDLAIDAVDYPIERAMGTVDFKLAIGGRGTGKLTVTGTPETGKVLFSTLTVKQPGGELKLAGMIEWLPGVGNVVFDLDISAQSFPVAEIVKFLDLGSIPITGELTGTLRLRGPKNALEGTGQVVVADGSIYGQPVTKASANITFTKGTVRATNLNVVAPAGTLTGQAELNLRTNEFNYNIQSTGIDLSRLQVLGSLAGILGGNLTVNSTGAGTFQQPQIVFNATLNAASVRGVNLPPGTAPPTLYIAVRNGQLIVRGSAADALTIEGNGTVAPDGTLNGLVRIRVLDIAKLLSLSPNLTSLPATGSITADLRLGGKLSSIEALLVDVTFPEFNVQVSGTQFVPVQPLHISMRDGRLVFNQFQIALGAGGSTFGISGYAGLTGAKDINIDVRGALEAALLQLFVRGARADGRVQIAAGVHGTLSKPTITGTAELQDAQVRFPGFPQLIDHITGTLVFRGDRVDIDALRANVGGGTVTAGGSVTLSGITPVRARIAMQGTGVAIRYFEGLTLEGNFNLLLTGDTGRAILQGDVNVSRAVYYRDIDLGNMILGVILARRGVTPVVAATWQDHVALRVHLAAPGTLALRNNIADVTGSGDLDLTGTLANPSILGTVTLDEGGKVRFQNVDYQLVRGS
ncbi:MAG TPA: translocation/assembly module TamB domain-containing protein, partial [Thermoanaerobaculia bacterium]|nr:translocation/assembly module TamB domain-containing protein [Thermoanaerobaculia bacterium]